jgi:hypothetical protein
VGKRRIFFINGFLLAVGWLLLMGLGGCVTTSYPTTSKQQIKYFSNSYHPSVQRADDIQYRGAYKYDLKGKKYKKHYREREKRKDKK